MLCAYSIVYLPLIILLRTIFVTIRKSPSPKTDCDIMLIGPFFKCVLWKTSKPPNETFYHCILRLYFLRVPRTFDILPSLCYVKSHALSVPMEAHPLALLSLGATEGLIGPGLRVCPLSSIYWLVN